MNSVTGTGDAVCVVTTIHAPAPAVHAWAKRFGDRLIVVGDVKTPPDWRCSDARFIAIDRASVAYAPTNHYARKNLGYLEAMRRGASVIYDTDDDNAPTPSWTIRHRECVAEVVENPGWCNAYGYFNKTNIWPRGLPLTHLRGTPRPTRRENVRCPIQQGLADGDPDVDAIWRLVHGDTVHFRKRRSIAPGPGTWCPFNSQSTWWFPEAYPLLYLPVTAPFRMTDIWRGFVAQRCLWEIGGRVAYHSPSEVVQQRNPHDIHRDFADEVPGYLHNGEIGAALAALVLLPGADNVTANMTTCYAALIELGVVDQYETAALAEWISAFRKITGG